ncbi:MAG: hypothetical protein HZA50_06155 [Planctomycetes bacterium]|nr:hypothetical protein [Planctomycetota bacterium]
MRIRTAIISICLCAPLAVQMPASAQAPARPAGRNPYDSLENDKLRQALTNMKMGEFIQELAKSLTGPEKDLTEMAGLLVGADAAADQKKREALYDEAFQKQEKIVEAMTKALSRDPTGEDVVKVYNARISLIDIQGLRRTKIYTDRMLYLLAGEEDRKEVEEHTAIAVKLLDALTKDINTQLSKWGQDTNRLIADRPALEEILPILKYKSAWIKYYRGSSILADDKSKDAERKTVLNESINLANEFVNNPEYGVVVWSRRLRASGYRETGQHKVAEADFAAVLGDATAPPDAKLESLFESARNLAEAGAEFIKNDKLDQGNEKFNLAIKAQEEFPQAAMDAVKNESARLGVDLKAAMLWGYIYELWSKAVRPKDPKKADEYMIKAQDSIVNLMNKYPQYNEELIKIFKEKYRTGSGGANPETMNPPILFGLAMEEIRKKTDDGRKKALEYLDVLIHRAEKGEQTAKGMYPLALLNKGIACSYLAKNIEAAETLKKVVELFPNFEKAPLAAYNAVNIYNTIINDYSKAHPGEDIPINYREGLVKCILEMLARYEKNPESFKGSLEQLPEQNRDLRIWYYDLGFNSEVLADYSETARRAKGPASAPAGSQPASGPAVPAKTREQWLADAIGAYEKYPQDKPEYIQCRDRIVHITWRPFEDFGEEDLKKDKEAVLKVVPKLQEFITFSKQKIGQLKTAVQTAENRAELEKPVSELLRMYDQTKPGSDEAARLKNAIDYKQLQESGSWAEFTALTLLYDLRNEKQVLPEIDKFPETWPGMPILRNSREYVIRKLVDEGKIKEAISKIQEFQRKYSSKDATDLISLVLSKVRRKINDLQALAKKDTAKKQELETYVKAYAEFAGTLYDDAKKSGAEPEKLYPLTQMYGESLLLRADSATDEEKAKFYKDAQACFQECYDYDFKERQQTFKKGKFDEIDRRLKAVDSVGADYNQLDKLTKDYFKFCSDNGIEIISGEEIQLRLTSDAMIAAPNEQEREKKFKKVKELLTAVYKALLRQDDRGQTRIDALIPIDATNVRGVGKCAFHLKDYGSAKKYYEQLLKGLDPVKYWEMYWEAKADLFEALLELNRKNADPKSLIALAMSINKLLIDAENDERLVMRIRPYRDRMLAVKNQANELAKVSVPAPATEPAHGAETPGAAESRPASSPAEGGAPAPAEPAASEPAKTPQPAKTPESSPASGPS